MPKIYKRTKDKKTGKVTKTLINPITGKTRTTTKRYRKGKKSSKTMTVSDTKFKETLGDYTKYKSKRYNKRTYGTRKTKAVTDKKTGKMVHKGKMKDWKIIGFSKGGVIQHD